MLPALFSGRRLVLALVATVLVVLPLVIFFTRGESAGEVQQRQAAAQALYELSRQLENGAAPVSVADGAVPVGPHSGAGEEIPTAPLPDSLTDARGERLSSGVSPEFESAQQSAGLAAEAPPAAQAAEGEGSLSGRVTDPDGNPIEGVCIDAYAFRGQDPEPQATECTAGDGTYTLADLPFDTYYVEFLDAVNLHQGSSDDVVVDGDVTGFDAVLQPGGAVSGEVTDTEGEPIAGICVTAYVENTGNSGRDCTDSEGRFQTSGVAPGPVGLDYYDENGRYLSATAQAVVALGQVTEVDPMELTLGGRVTGSVTDAETGAPAEGVCLGVFSQVGGYGSGCTDETGTFTTHGLGAGEYTISWSSYGRYLPPTSPSGTVTVELGETTTVDATAALGATISGRVTTADAGLPMAGVYVSAYGGTVGHFATTATDGTYTLAGLPYDSRAYQVSFSPSLERGYLNQWYDGASSWSEADPVTLTTREGATGIDAQLVRGAMLAGVVTSADGDPLSGVNVAVYGQGSPGMSLAYGTTDADGRYETSALPTGTYLVRFVDTSGRYIAEYWQDAATVETATPIPATAGTDVPGIDAVLDEGLTISGAVTSAVDGETPTSVRIDARDTGTGAVTSAWIGPSKSYELRGLAPGSYVVSFTDTAPNSIFRTQWYDGVDAPADATPVVLTDASATGIDAALRAGSYIAGTITGLDGRPIPGACATLYRADSTSTVVRTSCADGSGNYRLGGAGTGNFLIRFTAVNTDYVSTWYGGTMSPADAAIVSVPDGGQVDGVDVELDLGGRISGTLTRPGGAQACVYVYAVDTPYQPLSSTCPPTGAGPSSTWTSEALSEGEYLVRFYSWGAGGGYVDRWYDGVTDVQAATPVPVTVSQVTAGIDGALPDYVTVTGRLTDAGTGDALAQGCVTAEPTTWNNGSRAGTCTLRDGVWTLGLPPGQYTFSFTGTGYQQQWWQGASSAQEATPVAVSAGEPPGALDAALAAGAATVSGQLRDAATDEPLVGVCVRAPGSSSSSTEGCSDDTGAYSVSVAPGTYSSWQFRVEDPADVYAAQYLVLPDGGTGSVVLEAGQALSDVDAALQVGGRLTATVTADNNGVPLAGVCTQVSGVASGAAGYACTDANGVLRTKALPPGQVTVQFVNYNGRYAAEYFDDAASAGDATPVAVVAGQATNLTASLGLGGGLSGRLTLPDGGPAASACVLLTPLDAANGDPVTTCADPNGRWTSPGLRAGDWIVGATASGWAQTWYQNATTAAQATPVTVAAGETTSGIDIQLRKPQPMISGVVTDRDGQPVEGVCAYLYTGWDTSTGRAWCTGADGYYAFTADAEETYKVAVFDPAARYRTTWYGDVTDQANASLIYASGDGRTVTADVTVAAPTVVTATVHREGAPVSGVCGYLYPVDSDAAAVGTCTGDDGVLAFGDVADGDYVLGASDTRGRYATVWSGNAASREEASVVTVGSTEELSLGTLDVSPAQPGGGLLTGVVTDAATGEPVADVCGYVRLADGTPAGYATCTVDDGSYAIELPSGSYTIVFSDPAARYTTDQFDGVFAVDEAEVTEASLALSAIRRIEGRIVDQDGEPVAGVCVYAYDDGGATAGAFCTGDDGRWSISQLDAGGYRIGALDTAGAHQTAWIGGSSLGDATPVTVSDGAPVTSVGDVTTVGLGAASGQVLDAEGAPMAGVCVYVNRADGSYAQVGTCTGEDGTYWLGPLPEGDYTVAYYPPGVSEPTPYWYDGASDEASADRIHISAGETTALTDQSF